MLFSEFSNELSTNWYSFALSLGKYEIVLTTSSTVMFYFTEAVYFSCSYMQPCLHKTNVSGHGKVNIPFFRVTCWYYSKYTKGTTAMTPSICSRPRRKFSVLKGRLPSNSLITGHVTPFFSCTYSVAFSGLSNNPINSNTPGLLGKVIMSRSNHISLGWR